MKILLCLFISMLSFDASGIEMKNLEKIQARVKGSKQNYMMVLELMRQNLHFAALPYAAEYIIQERNWEKNFEKVLENLIIRTGPYGLAGIDPRILSSHNSPSLAFILGLKLFKDKDFERAIKALDQIPKGHRFKPEAHIVKASALNLLGKGAEANKEYESCMKLSEDLSSKAKHVRLSRYFSIINEQCQIHIARLAFKQKNYRKALEAYEKISKNSYLWPYIQLEKAWSHYYLDDPNRSLGLLVTYRSPLLSSYFMPESEVLTALSYHKLCLWDDTMEVVNQYYDVYKKRSDELKDILITHKNSNTYFLKMMLAPIETVEKDNPFIRNLLTQVRKRVKFSVDLINYNSVQEEFRKWYQMQGHTALSKQITKQVHYQMSWRTKQLNHYIKEQMFSFINDIHRFSYEMFNIRLEVLANKREQVYRTKLADIDKKDLKRTRGSSQNVKRKSTQHFYEFSGEFWADELGDYSFGLNSECSSSDEGSVLSYMGGGL